MPWSRPFEDPIDLPRGRQLVTLQDAARFIMKLPKAQQEAPEWLAATEASLRQQRIADRSCMKALNRNVERVFNSERKETHWGKRKLKRDQ
jgi:hypothetical protein